METEAAGSVCLFSAHVSAIGSAQVELMETMEVNQKAAEQQADTMLSKLEQENMVLQRRFSDLVELTQSDDYAHCIKVSEASVRRMLIQTAWTTLSQSCNCSRHSPRSSSLHLSKTGPRCPSAAIWERVISTESWQFRWRDLTKSSRLWQKKVSKLQITKLVYQVLQDWCHKL